MSRSPRYLTPEQIESRLAVLATVNRLLDQMQPRDSRRTIESRFAQAVLMLTHRKLYEAQRALVTASRACEGRGAAPVEQEVLDVVRAFNSLGPKRLEALLQRP